MFGQCRTSLKTESKLVSCYRSYLGQCLHGQGPLCDQLLPAGERGEDGEEVVPQVPADVDVQVSLDPGHDQGLGQKEGGS